MKDRIKERLNEWGLKLSEVAGDHPRTSAAVEIVLLGLAAFGVVKLFGG